MFPTEVGTPIAPRNLSRYFYQALDKAGLDDVRFHDLRHTAATFLGERGVSESVIGTILGHSGGSVTRKYVHATKTAMRMAVEQVEELRASTMYVTHDKGSHSDCSPGCSRWLLMRFINSTKRGSSCMSVQFGSDSNHL